MEDDARGTAEPGHGWHGMSATVVGGALAIGAPSLDAVIAEHAHVEPGGHACRACGHVYSSDLPVCPAIVLARAGYPGAVDRIRVVQGDDQITPLTWLQMAHERLEARVDALAAVTTAGLTATNSGRGRFGLMHAARSLWSRS
jgi:hypothetical protein